jgi:hypothetical protein
MARPKLTSQPPEWFKIERYQYSKMDAADWFLNLWARLWINNGAPSRHSRGHLKIAIAALREDPIIRRMELNPRHAIFGEADDPDFGALLSNELPSSSVEPLTVSNLYSFERLLPPEMREYGSKGDSAAGPPPRGFLGPLDDALPEQHLGRFVRVNLAHSDEEIKKSLLAHVVRERERLRKIDPTAPFLVAKENTPSHFKGLFKTWCEWQTLEVLDLVQWHKEIEKKVNWSNIDRWVKTIRTRREMKHGRLRKRFLKCFRTISPCASSCCHGLGTRHVDFRLELPSVSGWESA